MLPINSGSVPGKTTPSHKYTLGGKIDSRGGNEGQTVREVEKNKQNIKYEKVTGDSRVGKKEERERGSERERRELEV